MALNESEYRFDLVPEREREECLNYELEREITRRGGNQPAPAWLKLSEKSKQDYRNRTRIDVLGEREPVSMPSAILPSDCEIVRLPEVLIDWSYSNPTILKSVNKFLRSWLLEQRGPGGKASRTRIRHRGKRKKASTLLARLAAWRLAKSSRLTANEIEDKLKPLLRKNEIGIQGNLGRWCDEIDTLLS